MTLLSIRSRGSADCYWLGGAKPTLIVAAFLLFLSLTSPSLLSITWTDASAVSASTSSVGNNRRRKTVQHDYHLPSSSTTAKASSSSSSNTNCGHPIIPTNRRACGFYVWDAPSALFYKWCHHLLKDHIYEGKGGYLVRSLIVPVALFYVATNMFCVLLCCCIGDDSDWFLSISYVFASEQSGRNSLTRTKYPYPVSLSPGCSVKVCPI